MNRPYAPPSRAVRRTAEPPAKKSKLRRRVFLGVLFAAVALTWYFWPSRHLSAVKALQAELFSPAGRQLPADERRQKFEQLRAEEKMLSPAQKQGLRAEGMQRRAVEIDRYFHLSKEEKTRYLDDLIGREERRRKEWQAKGGTPGGGGPPGRPPGTNRPGGTSTRGANALSPAADRDKRRSDFLDAMPATQRAEMTEFRKDLDARRRQRGLPTGGRQ